MGAGSREAFRDARKVHGACSVGKATVREWLPSKIPAIISTPDRLGETEHAPLRRQPVDDVYGEAVIERFEAAASAGFEAIEFLFPYEYEAADLARRLADNGLQQVLFNLPPGDWEAGERGLASLAGRESDFSDALDLALDYAEVLGCPRVHVMAGIPGGDDPESAWNVYLGNLAVAAERASGAERTVVIEPINTRDIPGFFLNYSRDAVRAIESVGSPSLGLQLDLYHCQIMEGDLATHVRDLAGVTRHMQIAGVP